MAPLIPNLGTGWRSTSCSGCFAPGEEPKYPYNRMLGEPTELLWTFWRREKISCPCWDLNLGLPS